MDGNQLYFAKFHQHMSEFNTLHCLQKWLGSMRPFPFSLIQALLGSVSVNLAVQIRWVLKVTNESIKSGVLRSHPMLKAVLITVM